MDGAPRVVLGLIPLMALSACGDVGGPSAGATLGVVQAHHDAMRLCVPIGPDLPAEIAVDGPDRYRDALDALTQTGLLSATPVMKQGSRFGRAEREVPHRRYEVTDLGASAIRPAPDRFLGGAELCFARREVLSIESISEPTDAGGLKLARVTYRWRLDDIAPWAEASVVQAAIPALAEALSTRKGEATDTLLHTDTGLRYDPAIS